jgi:GTP cyclohydrolase FolE2
MVEITPREFVDQELMLIEHVFNQQNVVHPMVVFVKDDQRSAVMAEFRNDLHKEMLSEGIKELVKRSDPDVVIYAAEAWAAFVPDSEYTEETRAFNHPNRVEVIIVRIEFKTGEKYDCSANIIRERGKPRLSKFEVLPGGLSMGRFVDFFPVTRMN